MLHPKVVPLLKDRLGKKKLKPTALLFPISGRVPGGIERKTTEMIRLELAAARDKWLDGPAPDQRKRCEQSDSLRYKNAAHRPLTKTDFTDEALHYRQQLCARHFQAF